MIRFYVGCFFFFVCLCFYLFLVCVVGWSVGVGVRDINY